MKSSGEKISFTHKAGRFIEVYIDERLFTRYYYDINLPRPFLYPLIGPGGLEMTRSFPMEKAPGESEDHPHHRSVWTAYGDVNGVDLWSEVKDSGRIMQRRFKMIDEEKGEIISVNDWIDSKWRKVLEEERVIRIEPLPAGEKLVHYGVRLKAASQPVKLGDTKEGGIVAVRVAAWLKGEQGGKIRNSEGAEGEKDIWGKPACWCDYSGEVQDRKAGITIFDHPYNPRHATGWHVRDYGLFAANPFALSDYTGDKTKDGSCTIEKGESLEFRYLLYIHAGHPSADKLDKLWRDWSLAR